MGQRYAAVLLLSVFWASLLVPSVSALGVAYQEAQTTQATDVTTGAVPEGNGPAAHKPKNNHIIPPADETTTRPDDFHFSSGLPQPKNSDGTPATASGQIIPGVAGLTNKSFTATESLQAKRVEKTYKQEELVDKRTANSTTTRNADGSFTVKHYSAPKFFKKDGKWTGIDTTLVEDKNAGDSGNALGKALGTVESWVTSTDTYTIKDNDWQARFAPSDAPQGMIRIKRGNSQFGFSPMHAASVKPIITTAKNGDQTVHYYNLWPGVDVEYAVLSAELKENIVLKSSTSTASFAFAVTGGTLKKTKADANGTYGYAISGALNDEFAIAPLTISLNKYGLEARQPLTQKVEDGKLSIGVDRGFLKSLPKDAYPVIIDPTTTHQNAFGTRAGGNYVSFKSDGYVCDSTICNPLAGSVLDSQGTWRSWRGAIYSDYHEVRGKQLNQATLHLSQRLGLSTSGTTVVKNFTAWHATCLNFGCLGVSGATAAIGTVGDIDVTNVYQSRMNANDYDAWLMITGEEAAATTYKNWDPQGSYVQFTYTDVIPSPSVVAPVDGQVFIDPQVSFITTTPTNPASGAALQYIFCVSTSPGCSGAVMVSSPQSGAQWTISDGILQDGTTYYIQMQSYDPNIAVYSAWGVPKSFKIDSRTGKDSTQAYDTLGPVSVDLATGNMSTSTSSHASSALGGSLGVSLDYNSPVRSRHGLVGSYYNNTSLTGDPVLTRVDQQIDFNWDTGSPASGVVNNDSFGARWQGYFVAPVSGTYYFGGAYDDTLAIYINDQSVFSGNAWSNTPLYGTTGVTLQAGQTAKIKVETVDAGGSLAYAHLWVKGAVADQVVKSEWLQTGVRDATQKYGLTGRYYKDNGTHDFNDAANTLIMQRTDPLISFDWIYGSAVSGGPVDNFMARWSGYFTAPAAGTYYFGTKADDGSRIYINGNPTPVMQNWNPGAHDTWYGSGVTLGVGQTVPITVEYFEATYGANISLFVKGAVPEQIVPATWLSSKASVLPDGWNLGVDPDGNISYDHINATPNGAVLSDSTGSTHEYKWDTSKQAYIPPVNEDGTLVRNADATYTFQDADGRTYVFNADGTVASVTSPIDDAHPAALQYSYGGTPSHLTQITDGVDSNRWARVYYSGDANCTSAPTGFDAQAPSGMLCAVKTNDNRITSFFYKGGYLSRIVEPGSEVTDYQYDTSGRIVAIRDSLANDAIGAGVRADDATANTSVSYDDIGRVTNVTQPAATAGATRTQHTINYYPGNGAYYGATEQHVVGSSEPNGFTHRIEYDNLFRTTRDTDIANLSDNTEWNPVKDLVLSTTDETGMKSTTIYDDEDRAINQYGPAPAAWYGADRKPLSTYANQVPRTDTAFDENMRGASTSYYTYSTASKSLTGTPKLHTTNLSGASAPGDFNANWGATSPVPGVSSNWGFRATGRLRLPASGTYRLRVSSDGGVRVYIDDQLSLDDWNDGSSRWHPVVGEIALDNTAGSVHKLRVEYYHTTGTANFGLYFTPPGGSETVTGLNQYLSPDYSLTTSNKTYDSTLGNSTTTTNYGTSPELGLARSTTVDPTGLNLTTTSSYEQQGATGSYLRQTAKYLPGANTSVVSTATLYTYYGATETRDNPCTTSITEAYRQAGMLKIKTEPDPDGTGSQTPRTTETIYDDTGKVVATRYNTDSWTCTTYDTRGRATQTKVPAFNGESARTITNNYAVNGNPLVTSTTDDSGSNQVTTDLTGRTKSYTDAYGDVTTSTFDDQGHLTQRVSQLGTESFTYNAYDQLVDQLLDGITYAHITYDSYGRIANVTYPATNQQRTVYGRDSLGRLNSLTHTLGDGTSTVADTVTLSQSSQVISGTENGTSKSYNYDGLGRLTAATIGSNSYTYGFGAQNTTTCGTGTNPNSGKNSNRTSQTVNGTTTYFCYDYADRLTGSSNALYNTPTYDAHGNMTKIGTGTTPLYMFYDSADRSSGYEQYNSSQNGLGVYYDRDSQGRIIARYKDTITNGNWTNTGEWYYGFTGGADTPDYVRNSAWQITEKYLQLPGNVLLTIRPQQTGNAQKTYSLPNIHGDIFATTNAAGALLSTTLTGPFGETISGQSIPNNTVTGSTFSWVGQHEKITDIEMGLYPTQMGQRVYLASLGRFTQVDPDEGGTANNYVYPPDPVNDFDLAGTFGWKSFANVASIGSMLPGPIGMASAAAAAAAYAKVGDKKNAALMVAGIAAAAVGAGVAVKAAKVMKNAKPFAKATGINSRLFGSGASYKKVGTVRKGILNQNNYLRIGWQGNKTSNLVFRIAVGPSKSHAQKMSRLNPVRYIHWHPYIRRW